jgi:hypothetical protein
VVVNPTLLEGYPDIPKSTDIINALENNGYAEVPFMLGRAACEELFDDFLGFVELCQQPDTESLVQAVTFDVNGLGNGAYHMTYRAPGSINPVETDRTPGSDHKYTFHFGTQTKDRATQALGGALPVEMKQCLETADEFFQEVLKSARIGAVALGLEQVMFGDKPETWVHHMRLLHYIGDTPDLGAAHFDRSVATLAVSESRSGLRGAPGQNGYLEPLTIEQMQELEASLMPVAHHEHVSKFFLGAGFNHLPEKDRKYNAPLFGHDILNDAPDTSRQAVVCFLNPTTEYSGYTVPGSDETGFAEIYNRIQATKDRVA